jgi:hypothetical protein
LDDFRASFTDLPIRSEASYLQSVSTDGRPLPENSKAGDSFRRPRLPILASPLR